VWVKPKNAISVGAASAVRSAVPSTVGLHKGATFETAARIGVQNLEQALTYISGNAVNGDQYYIVLGADETVAPKTLYYSAKVVGITLMTNGTERTVQLASNGSLFSVRPGVTLKLENNVTLNGKAGNNRSLVTISSANGTFIMNGGKITGNTNSSSGGGVLTEGTFTMNGGEISGNTASDGGGVHIYATVSSAFTMNGGKISGNTADSTGGGVCNNGSGTFTMNDGEISGNTASGGGGVGAFGGSDGNLTMNGGKINGNTATNSGGGVDLGGGTFAMTGGEISGNTASGTGGGVYINPLYGRFTKSSTGGVITGYGSDTIAGNRAGSGVQSNRGHAVYVVNSSPVKRLENTVAATKALDSQQNGAAGGWTE
jgi:hypothetical protein